MRNAECGQKYKFPVTKISHRDGIHRWYYNKTILLIWKANPKIYKKKKNLKLYGDNITRLIVVTISDVYKYKHILIVTPHEYNIICQLYLNKKGNKD